MAGYDPDNLQLTDFMDLATLQEIQDSFAAIAEVKATITDAAGNVLTQPNPTREFLRRQQALEETPPTGDGAAAAAGPGAEAAGEGVDGFGVGGLPQREGSEYV